MNEEAMEYIYCIFEQIPQIVDEPRFTNAVAEFSARIIHIFDRIDKKNNDTSDEYDRSAVLVFLPGFGEIEEMRNVLLSEKHVDAKWDIIILHSLISTEDQENIFKKPPINYRRIILSTNIAESSITVPDVKYGKLKPNDIDLCRINLICDSIELQIHNYYFFFAQ